MNKIDFETMKDTTVEVAGTAMKAAKRHKWAIGGALISTMAAEAVLRNYEEKSTIGKVFSVLVATALQTAIFTKCRELDLK